MTIGKLATATGGRRAMRGYASAREGFRALLEAATARRPGRVLLPAYIGWSAREGSGVFDPVRALGTPHSFYRLDDRLRVDAYDVRRQLAHGDVSLLLLIHYFGWPDAAAAELAAEAREAGIVVVEDEAHAMLTDLVGGASGRHGDAALFSLHKLLPVPDGGVVLFNDGARIAPPEHDQAATQVPHAWHEFDLHRYALARRRNATLLLDRLAAIGDHVEPLWPTVPDGVVPQTLPVLVRGAWRDALHAGMNAAGFGLVSLYHTLVDAIPADTFPEVHALARRITNLPVHQDITVGQLDAMMDELARQVRTLAAGSR